MLTLLMTMSRSLIIICGIIPGPTDIIVGNAMLMMLTMLMIAMSRSLIIIDQSPHASGTWRGGGRKRKHSRFWTLYFEQNTDQSGSHFTKYLDVLIVIMCFFFKAALVLIFNLINSTFMSGLMTITCPNRERKAILASSRHAGFIAQHCLY